MIYLKDLLLENPTLFLREANSGYSDHKLHKEISKKIFDCWLILLNGIERKNVPIVNLKNDEIKKSIETGENFTLNIHDVETAGEIQVKIECLLAFINRFDLIAIYGAATVVGSDPIELYLQVNKNYTIQNILSQKNYIEELASHEAVHVIKHFQKLHQLSSEREHVLTNKDKKWWYKYYTHKNELHSYISQINNELKHIKQKNKDISFSDALHQSKIWKRYEKDIFSKNSKIRNKMLSKLANYWNVNI